MEVTLGEEDVKLVLRVLEYYLPQLKDEVYHTENFDWRQDLKKDEEAIKALLVRLNAAANS